MLMRSARGPAPRAGGSDAGGKPEGTDPGGKIDESRGAPLPGEVAGRLGGALGHDLSHVSVHTDAPAAAAAQDINARAFTQGPDIYFAPGEFAPGTTRGNETLAHEAVHVVQHDRGHIPHAEPHALGVSEPSDPLEQEARTAGHAAAASLAGVSPATAPPTGAGGVAPTRGRAMLMRWAPEGEGAARRPSEADIIELRGLLIGEGIRDSELGNLESLRSWPFTRFENAWNLFHRLNSNPVRGRRGAMHRVAKAWNAHLDDLGAFDPWPTVLHYVHNLDELSIASLDRPYDEEGRASGIDAMMNIRIAGARTGVHPRAVYFAAAAQLGMDVRAGIEAGQGHYIPAGGFRVLLRDIRDQAQRLALHRVRHGRRRPRLEPRDEGLEGGARIYGMLLQELNRAVQVLREQQEEQSGGDDLAPGHSPDEHREPGIRAYLLPRADRIAALPAASDDAAAPANAYQLLEVLGQVPGGGDSQHGAGSVDPHGTDHALGLAIDLHHGRGRDGGSQQNFGITGEYWPFIYELLTRHGSSYGLSPRMRPDAVHELEPQQARALSTMVRECGQRLADEVTSEATVEETPEVARERNAALRSYRHLRQEVRLALMNRIWALNSTRAHRYDRTVEDATRGLIETEMGALRRDKDAVMSLPPDQVLEVLDQHIVQLNLIETALAQQHTARVTALEVSAEAEGDREEAAAAVGGITRREQQRLDRRERGRERRLDRARNPGALDDVGPDDGRIDLTALRARLEASRPAAEGAFRHEQHRALHEIVRRGGFRRWLTTASDPDRPLYDQPQIMVEALDDVRAHDPRETRERDTHFYGGHHWTIAPREILRSTDEYRESLLRDMQYRQREGQLERVIMIMAESAGGQDILYGARDVTFHEALATAAGGQPEAQGILERVFRRVVEPFQQGNAPGAAGDAARDARDRGHY